MSERTSGIAPAKKVLVTEDDREIRLALIAALEGEDYLVTGASNGAEALEIFGVFQPDLALLDLRLPDISGTEICARIRETSDIPVIILSAIDFKHVGPQYVNSVFQAELSDSFPRLF